MAQKEKKEEKTSFPFGPRNYMLMGAALVAIVIGYFSLSAGSITLAPILLVLGYCVLFPLGIIWGGGKGEVEETGE